MPPNPNTAGGQSADGVAGRDIKAPENRSKVQRFALFLSDSNVDVVAMVDCTQELLSFYECYDQYNEKNAREQINRSVKARGLDR